MNRYFSPPAWLLSGMLLCFSTGADARCSRMWDTAKVVHSGASPLAAIPMDWFRGIDIVRNKIDAQSGIKTNLYLCEASAPNAFAWIHRGRKGVALTTGLWLLLGNDWHAYAAIVGHENAHHALGHRVLRVTRGMTLSGISAFTGIPAIGTRAINAPFSQKEELDADKHGLRYALCAGFSPGGAARLLDKLNTTSSPLHSHPSSKLRIRSLQTAAKAHERAPRCRQPLTARKHK